MTKIKNVILYCLILVMSVAVALTSAACSCSEKPNKKPDVKITLTLSETELTLDEDETFVLKATTDSNDSVKWTTSNGTVASVSAQGKVIAKSVGETTITARVGDVKKECKVTVKNSDENTKIVLSKNPLNLSLTTGNEKITGTVTTNGATAELGATNATYRSDNESVATVSADGTVTPVSLGSAIIFVTSGKKTKPVAVEIYSMFISTPEDWNAMINSDEGNLNARYILTNDIDFTNNEYEIKQELGGDVILSESVTGYLNGDGHTVKNVTMPKSVTEQSLFGTIVGFTMENIAFENIRFTTSKPCGIAVRMVQHYNADGKSLVAYDNIKNVSLDFVYEVHGAYGICGKYYGGGFENVFLNMRMADGGNMDPLTDYAITKDFYVWYDNNYMTNVVVLAEKGGVNSEWIVHEGSRDVSKELLFVCGSKMEAGYNVRTRFDSVFWTVAPGELPKLK